MESCRVNYPVCTAGAYEAVEGGFAHHGMLKSAQWLLEREGDRIRSLLEEHPG